MTPQHETLMLVAGTAESIVPLLSLVAYIPQWRKLYQTRNSGPLSMISWVIWALSYAIAVFYSIVLLSVTGRGWPLLVTTVSGLLMVLYTMILIWRFRDRSCDSPKKESDTSR